MRSILWIIDKNNIILSFSILIFQKINQAMARSYAIDSGCLFTAVAFPTWYNSHIYMMVEKEVISVFRLRPNLSFSFWNFLRRIAKTVFRAL